MKTQGLMGPPTIPGAPPRTGAETVACGSVAAQLGQPALLLLPEQAADGRLDALALGAFVQGVLAAVAAAGVAAWVPRSTAGSHQGAGGAKARPQGELTVSVRVQWG